MMTIVTSPLFYVFITVGIYVLFAWLSKRFKTALFNPLLWTIAFIVGYILLIVFIDKGNVDEANIQAEVARYQQSASILDVLLAPVTVALAIPLYANRNVLKENWVAIIVATVVGTLTSVGSVFLLGWALNLQQDITYALIPRGVTTAIAKEVSVMLGVSAYTSITVTVVVLTGIVGAVLGPLLIKLFHDKNDVTVGLALGSASHAIGTSKAFDYSSKAGAIASVSIATNGLFTVIVALIVRLVIGT